MPVANGQAVLLVAHSMGRTVERFRREEVDDLRRLGRSAKRGTGPQSGPARGLGGAGGRQPGPAGERLRRGGEEGIAEGSLGRRAAAGFSVGRREEEGGRAAVAS